MSSLEYIRIGALLTIGALTVVGAAKILSENFRRLWRRFLPARFHGDFCHCDGCMGREQSESETLRLIERFRAAAREKYDVRESLKPEDPDRQFKATYLSGAGDALSAIASDLALEWSDSTEDELPFVRPPTRGEGSR